MSKALSESKYLLRIVREDIGTTIIINIKTGRTGVSKCRKSEAFSTTIGTAVAWLRYCYENYDMPIVSKRVSWDDVLVGDRLWIYVGSNKYKQYTVTKKYKSNMGISGFLTVKTYDLDLVDDSGSNTKHLSGIDHSFNGTALKPVTACKEYWKCIDEAESGDLI